MAKKGKKIATILKLQIPAGEANPSPPVGPALGQAAVNIKTQGTEKGLPLPVAITVYEDKSFTFEVKSAPAAVLIKKVLGLTKGSAVPNRDKVGTITRAQLEEIVTMKQKDLNANEMDQAVKIIEGTARSMGVEVK